MIAGWRWLFVGLALLPVLLVTLGTATYGVGQNAESVVLISTADHLRAGEGWVNYADERYVQPPLYPLLLALIDARTLNALLAGAAAAMAIYALAIWLKSAWLFMGASLALALSAPLFLAGQMALPTLLLALLVLGLWIALLSYVRTRRSRHAWIAAALCALALLTDAAGLAALVVTAVVLWLSGRKVALAAVCVVIALMPLLVWVIVFGGQIDLRALTDPVRLLALIYLPLIVALAYWLDGRQSRLALVGAIGGAALAFVSAAIIIPTMQTARQDGAGGFMITDWVKSPLIARVRSLPAGVIFSNAPDALYAIIGGQQYPAPSAARPQSALLRDLLANGTQPAVVPEATAEAAPDLPADAAPPPVVETDAAPIYWVRFTDKPNISFDALTFDEMKAGYALAFLFDSSEGVVYQITGIVE
jgi:hypothetical protein